MAEKKKNLVEEALLQMKNLEEAITENAKGILASTMKQEISELVKESLSDKDMEIEEEEMSMDIEGEESEMTEQEEDVLDTMEDAPEDEDMDMEDEIEMEDEFEMDDESEIDIDSDEMLMTDLPGDELEVDDEDEILLPLDLTGASDEEILKVFKAMGEEDGIVVTQDENEITLKDNESDVEYKIQTEGEEEYEMYDKEMSEEDDFEEEDEIVYEIELEDDEFEEEMTEGQGYDDKEDEKEGMKHGKMSSKHLKSEKSRRDDAHFETRKEEEKESSIRSFVNGRKLNKKPQDFPKNFKRPGVRNEALEKEISQLREKNEEYRKALNIFKEKLNEVAVFNSNLAYATRLFTEHSTTKQEKINILRRFDSVETIKESKSLYKTIKEDLDTKENSVMNESVKSKVHKSPSKGSATNLIENKTYENPQFLRMKDLMNKLK